MLLKQTGNICGVGYVKFPAQRDDNLTFVFAGTQIHSGHGEVPSLTLVRLIDAFPIHSSVHEAACRDKNPERARSLTVVSGDSLAGALVQRSADRRTGCGWS